MRNLNHGGTWKAIRQDYYWCKKTKTFKKRNLLLKCNLVICFLVILFILTEIL